MASTIVVCHTMIIVNTVVEDLTRDQPVYMIAKQVQCHYPENYGEDKLLMMMGSLHIEMNFLAAIEDWLEGRGWIDLPAKSSIKTPERADSMLKEKQVKRSRYVHQVSCAALYLLLCDGYVDSECQAGTFHHWIEDRCESTAQFNYWLTLIQMEALLLKLVRSLRESDFQMFVNEIAPWMFALDHTHYARWLPIFILDLKMLET